MLPHSPLWHYLWIAPHALQLLILIVMLWRGLFREFPIFFAYTAFDMAAETTLFILDHSRPVTSEQYWTAHWIFLGVEVALRFAIIYELVTGVFKDYPALTQLVRILFRGATMILLFAAVAVAARAPNDGTFPILSRVHVFDLSVDVMQSGLLLLLVGFASYCGLSWRSPAYGIAFGFGVFASVDLATETLRLWSGWEGGYAFDFINMISFHCCVVIWLVYLLLPERARRTMKEPPKNNLEQWNAELRRLLLQ
jgi:hypothetical protein